MTKHRIPPHPSVAYLADKAFRAGINITDGLNHAKIPGSTWTRWRKGGKPNVDTVDRLDRALDELIETVPLAGAEPG